MASQAKALEAFAAIVSHIPHGSNKSGTFGDQRRLVWSVLEWAAEQQLPKEATQRGA